MHISSFVLSSAILSLATIAQAEPPRAYSTLAEAIPAEGNLNCSGTSSSGAQIHVHVDQDGSRVVGAQVVSIRPGVGVYVLDLHKEFKLRESSVVLSGQKATLHAEYNNMDYFNASFDLTVTDSSHGMRGEVSFDDGDGLWLDSTNLKCSALNYTLIP